MNRLEEIGFYTLSDERVRKLSVSSNLKRCELILTSRCNFNCPYCRGMKEEDVGDLSPYDAFDITKKWIDNNLENIRFSGGEPTLWKNLKELVVFSKQNGIKRIALSTNGSAQLDTYIDLYEAGVNDFSISLDSCCSSVGNMMTGHKKGVWERIVSNIKSLSEITYVTTGVVLTNKNYHEINDIISFASSLGVSDIRIIPAAQIAKRLKNLKIEDNLLSKHPILKYRYYNFLSLKNVRGIEESDNHQCPLVLDDMAVLNNKHYPCIIYMREQGKEIGNTYKSIQQIRNERLLWYKNHNCFTDKICRDNCLDVCIDFNNRYKLFNG